MINLSEEMIFTARTRKRRPQFSVGERAAKRTDTADCPSADNETCRQFAHLETKAGEDAGAHHVGDHDAGAVKSEIVRAP